MNKHPVVAYMHGVLDGSVPAGRMIHLAVERHLGDLKDAHLRGLRFDRQAAEMALAFFGFLRHSKGEWAGQPFVLSPWQMFTLWVLFGWRRADGTRRFRTGYEEVPRKNGKTTKLAGVGLLLLVADGEPGAEVYSAATKRDQAKICWSEAARMVARSPALAGMITHARAASTLSVEATASKFEPLSADSNTLDGLNVHVALIDELHAHKTRGVIDALDTATGARRQPLVYIITTAGFDRASVCFDYHEYARQVLEGTIEDDSFFAFIASIDEGDRWDDPAAWAKANPNLGVSVKLDDLERKAARAKKLPAALNAFLRLHLNVWTQQSTRWINIDLWGENNAHPIDEALLPGRPCYGGLDLSSVSDITAWVLVFPHEDDPGQLDILARFWCPAARLDDSENQYREQYQAWAAAGHLTATEGDGVDYSAIRAQVLQDASRFQLVSMNVDRLFQGYQLAQELADEGIEIFGMGQGFLSMAIPMKEFERRLLARQLHHGDNPVLKWMAGNMAVRSDPAGNLKPDKAENTGSRGGAKKHRKIDGIVGLVMAIDRVVRLDESRSVYQDRGLLTL